jgi:hypothetical protein
MMPRYQREGYCCRLFTGDRVCLGELKIERPDRDLIDRVDQSYSSLAINKRREFSIDEA